MSEYYKVLTITGHTLLSITLYFRDSFPLLWDLTHFYKAIEGQGTAYRGWLTWQFLAEISRQKLTVVLVDELSA